MSQGVLDCSPFLAGGCVSRGGPALLTWSTTEELYHVQMSSRRPPGYTEFLERQEPPKQVSGLFIIIVVTND